MNTNSNDRLARPPPLGGPFTFFLPRSQTFLSRRPEALDLRNMRWTTNV